MSKKDKMVSCGASSLTNWAEKNSNIITLVTIIILTTLTYLMPDAYSKPCQISQMMRYIENPGIVKTVYSSIFKNI